MGAIGNNGKQAYYSEKCAALVVAAPSNSYVTSPLTIPNLGFPLLALPLHVFSTSTFYSYSPSHFSCKCSATTDAGIRTTDILGQNGYNQGDCDTDFGYAETRR